MFSSPQLNSDRFGKSRPESALRVRSAFSATLGCSRLHSAALGSSAVPDSAPRCNGGRWRGPAARPEPREGTERWHSRLSPGHPGPARARVPRSAPCSAERGLGARSGANGLGSAAAPGGGGRCPQGRKNHPAPPIFARSFGVWAAKGKRLQHQALPWRALVLPTLWVSQGWHRESCRYWPELLPFGAILKAVLAGAPWSLPSPSPGTRREPCPKWLWHLGRDVAAAPEQLEEKTSQQRQIAVEARVVFGAGSAESCICLCCHSLGTAWEKGLGDFWCPSEKNTNSALQPDRPLHPELSTHPQSQQGRDKRIPVG
ncbi:uncharacterized protein LOC134418621 isoform X2 [Melospiza melodia melodia]|uniref:uncharacterized protein LOC134418621 isoform X2 n=1 Tax=Melospiza melodia melodia TaxID=1914991 RepID=UPI002FD37385